MLFIYSNTFIWICRSLSARLSNNSYLAKAKTWNALRTKWLDFSIRGNYQAQQRIPCFHQWGNPIPATEPVRDNVIKSPMQSRTNVFAVATPSPRDNGPHSLCTTLPPLFRCEFAIFITKDLECTLAYDKYLDFDDIFRSASSALSQFSNWLECVSRNPVFDLVVVVSVYNITVSWNDSCRYSHLFTLILISLEDFKFFQGITSSLIFPNALSH